MSTILVVLLTVAGIILLVLIAAFFMRKEHYVKREIVIGVSSQEAYDFLRFLDNQEKFNKWAASDKDRIKEFKGTDGTVGFVYSWRGEKDAGVGEKEIMNLVEGRKIETEIRFKKPMEAKATVVMETESLGANQTRVSLTNSGKLNYPLNIMIPVFEKNFGKEMSNSLVTLKDILERR